MKKSVCLGMLWMAAACAFAQGLVQVRQDFSKDPGWEWKNNRVVAQDPPTIKQDFGWAPTNHTGAGPGEIGGTIWQSTTPAWYALPLNKPLSFKDKYSCSFRVAFMPTKGAGVVYVGFFNHKLQGWRVWNSMALRLGGESSGEAAIGVDSATAEWLPCGGAEGYQHVPADGKPHTIRFTYDPDAVPGAWPDPRLEKYMGYKRQSTEQILEKMQKDEPNITREEVEKLLVDACAEGKLYYLQRTGHESVIGPTAIRGIFWGIPKWREAQGMITTQVDDGKPFKSFISKPGHDGPVYMDRFGVFNLQLYHQFIDFYMSDLEINGHKVDLSMDPGWEAHGNRVEFVEQDFQRQNFGYSETNWAGDGIGELGGAVCRVEPQEELHGYYADAVGALTLDDPISFSGNLNFTAGATDAGMFFGYFNAKAQDEDSTPGMGITPVDAMMGIVLDSPKGGFGAVCTPTFETTLRNFSLPITATGERHAFSFDYNPAANGGLGEIACKLDDKSFTMKLGKAQREAKATFDHFGLVSPRVGGKHVIIYFDDLLYTARRPENYRPKFHKQEVVKTKYPKGGRAF